MPGPVSSAMSTGCYELIREAHATLVTSVEDIVETVGRLGAERPATVRPRRRTDDLGPQALQVHEALGPRSGKSAERLAAESGVPLSRVRAVLPELELEGLVERCDTGWRRAG